ncbi:MAG TPA: hypothetical protein VGD90_12580 [Sphingobacteriaceae bacterium]
MKKYAIFSVILLAAAWMIWDAVKQPGVQDLKGDFKELVFVRNEQNTGPVVRIYAVSVNDTLWQEMEKYGRYMPHTKYGVTKVYFFKAGSPAPQQVSLEGDNIPEEFKPGCIGRYEKNAMGQIVLSKYPFKD